MDHEGDKFDDGIDRASDHRFVVNVPEGQLVVRVQRQLFILSVVGRYELDDVRLKRPMSHYFSLNYTRV